MSNAALRITRCITYGVGGALIGSLLGLVLGMIVHSLAVISAGHTINTQITLGFPWAPRWGAIVLGTVGLLIAGYAGVVADDSPAPEDTAA